MSDWSEPVGTFYGATLRARLVVLRGHTPGDASDLLQTMVYVELQNLGLSPTEVYFDAEHGHDFRPEYKGGLDCELSDAHGKPVPQSPSAFSGGCPSTCWITLQYDSTVRLRANCYGIRGPKEGGLVIPAPGRYWFLKAGDTNNYFLSATFTTDPPTNRSPRLSITNMHVWSGTLTIPKTKIVMRP
ncbi:MAG: hypothetical protein EXS18_05870 [Verrucomicrobiae bacterium]|nr:hypothetical protein [Verrucomicrobiae bacterium]